jgi:hypothetical protein
VRPEGLCEWKNCSTCYKYLPECFKGMNVKHCSCDTKHVLLLGPPKNMKLYFSVSVSQRSITYASLEGVRGEGGVVEGYRTVILYCLGEGGVRG